MNRILNITGIALLLFFAAGQADAQGRAAVRGTRANSDGGVTHVSGSAAQTPAGGKVARGRAVRSDGQGNVVGGSAAAGQTAAGGTAG
ncbi:MAG: hypothetical protein KDI78_03785, partial [Xanthomonadales bacterium]|nr:hypothetical protein [Xanthomonadales bacterium]